MSKFSNPGYIITEDGSIQVWISELIKTPDRRIIKRYGKLNGAITIKVSSPKSKNIEGAFNTEINKMRKKGYIFIDKEVDPITYKALFDKLVNNTTPKELRKLIEILTRSIPVDKTNTVTNHKIPMKFKPAKGSNIELPVIVQPKINGARITLDVETIGTTDLFNSPTEKIVIKSYSGINYNIPRLETYLNNFPPCDFDFKQWIKDNRPDGEVYSPGYKHAAIAGAASNPNNPLNEKLVLCLFDYAIGESLFKDNIKHLSDTLRNLAPNSVRINVDPKVFYGLNKMNSSYIHYLIHLVPTFMVTDYDKITEHFNKALKYGYEGIIIRQLDCVYKFGSRTSKGFKMKKILEGEFTIVNIDEYQRDPGVGIAICRNDINNLTFPVTIQGTVEFRREVLRNKDLYIGNKCIIQYYERTVNGLPDHATAIITPIN